MTYAVDDGASLRETAIRLRLDPGTYDVFTARDEYRFGLVTGIYRQLRRAA